MTAPRYIAHLLPTSSVPSLAGSSSVSYTPDSLAAEGFIHCSPLALTLDTANRYLATLPAVSVLVIDTHHASFSVATAQVPGGPTTHVAGSGAVKLVWEPAVVPPEHERRAAAAAAAGKGVREGDFPHVYGPIDMQSVVEVLSVKRDAAGKAWEAIPGLESYLA